MKRVWLVNVKERELEGFGVRLAEIRKSRGLTQTDLGAAVGVSKRVIAYYELESTQPPGAMLPDLARALGVAVEELLGTKPIKEKLRPKTARLLKRLQRVEELPNADQKAVLKFVDALIQSRGLDESTQRSPRRAARK